VAPALVAARRICAGTLAPPALPAHLCPHLAPLTSQQRCLGHAFRLLPRASMATPRAAPAIPGASGNIEGAPHHLGMVAGYPWWQHLYRLSYHSRRAST